MARKPADAVVFPGRAEEAAAILRLCAETGVVVVPFGAGSSLEGQMNAPFGDGDRRGPRAAKSATQCRPWRRSRQRRIPGEGIVNHGKMLPVSARAKG